MGKRNGTIKIYLSMLTIYNKINGWSIFVQCFYTYPQIYKKVNRTPDSNSNKKLRDFQKRTDTFIRKDPKKVRSLENQNKPCMDHKTKQAKTDCWDSEPLQPEVVNIRIPSIKTNAVDWNRSEHAQVSNVGNSYKFVLITRLIDITIIMFKLHISVHHNYYYNMCNTSQNIFIIQPPRKLFLSLINNTLRVGLKLRVPACESRKYLWLFQN